MWLHRVPPGPISYFKVYETIILASIISQGLALLGFLLYAILFFQSLINADIFLPLSEGPDFQMFFDLF